MFPLAYSSSYAKQDVVNKKNKKRKERNSRERKKRRNDKKNWKNKKREKRKQRPRENERKKVCRPMSDIMSFCFGHYVALFRTLCKDDSEKVTL